MKKGIIFILLLSVILVLSGCNSTAKNSPNSLRLTKDDEKIIFKYLDTKTNDISSPVRGTMFSAFDILGSDSDKIYLYVLKEECLKHGNEVSMTNGVSLPVVLNIEIVADKIEIKSHSFPEDGEAYAKSIKKLFPENVREIMSVNHNERVTKLEEDIKKRITSQS